MTLQQSYVRCFILTVIVAASLGCAASRKIETLPLTPFLDIPGVDKTSKLSNIPFDHSWVRDKFDGRKYNKFIVAPVSTAYLNNNGQLESTSAFITTKEAYDEEVKKLAEYATQTFRKAFEEDERKRVQIVDVPGPGTLNLEIALSQVVFGHPGVYAGSFASPLPGTGVLASAVTQPTVAFEFRLKDSVTGEVVATAADRRTPKIRIVDFNQLTATSSCRDIADAEAEVLADVIANGRFVKTRASWFSFSLW